MAATLGIRGKITAGQDSYHLEHHSREQLKNIDYIVPKWPDEAGFAREILSHKAPRSKAEVLFDAAFSKGSYVKPKTYKDLMLSILRKEAKKAAKQ